MHCNGHECGGAKTPRIRSKNNTPHTPFSGVTSAHSVGHPAHFQRQCGLCWSAYSGQRRTVWPPQLRLSGQRRTVWTGPRLHLKVDGVRTRRRNVYMLCCCLVVANGIKPTLLRVHLQVHPPGEICLTPPSDKHERNIDSRTTASRCTTSPRVGNDGTSPSLP